MASTLIGITSRKRFGKDTAGAHLVENLYYSRLALADPIMQILAVIDPFVEGKARRNPESEWGHDPAVGKPGPKASRGSDKTGSPLGGRAPGSHRRPAALDVSFKHQDALDAARWEGERIGRAMRGEETPQPTLDPELEALKKRMRINFPDAPTAGRSSAGRGGDGSGRPLEVARRHDKQRRQRGGSEL